MVHPHNHVTNIKKKAGLWVLVCTTDSPLGRLPVVRGENVGFLCGETGLHLNPGPAASWLVDFCKDLLFQTHFLHLLNVEGKGCSDVYKTQPGTQ